MGGVCVMLLGGKGGCQQCTCVPCDACTRTCQNPHTGTAFETVYTLYFEGAESGNVGDGYLTASGDSDTSDPYDGMDGNGPWFQQIVGTFTVNSTQTRHPCRVTVSFWRNNFVLGASTIPPPSAALTSQSVKVEVTAGAVIVGDRVIVPADGEVTIDTVSIPLVTGSGDQSGNDPRFFDGSITVAPQCESATFSIRARIEWNTKKRQHVLYGLVRECYESDSPCATFCSGSPPPSTLYVTLSNVNVTAGPSGAPSVSAINALANDWIENKAWVMERVPMFCQSWDTGFIQYGPCSGANANGVANANVSQWSDGIVRYNVLMQTDVEGVGCYGASIRFGSNATSTPPIPICGAYSQTGTGGLIRLISAGGIDYDYTGTFDWKVES